MGWALACKGKATSNVTYNPDDLPSAYCNPSVHSRIQAYTEMALLEKRPSVHLKDTKTKMTRYQIFF